MEDGSEACRLRYPPCTIFYPEFCLPGSRVDTPVFVSQANSGELVPRLSRRAATVASVPVRNVVVAPAKGLARGKRHAP